jgi:hypothetical protein
LQWLTENLLLPNYGVFERLFAEGARAGVLKRYPPGLVTLMVHSSAAMVFNLGPLAEQVLGRSPFDDEIVRQQADLVVDVLLNGLLETSRMTDVAEKIPVRDGAAAAPLIQSIHHVAFRCFDAEETRRFYEDIMGMELAAALVFDEAPGGGERLEYMHLFFRMGDENFIAFFDLPDHLGSQKFKSTSGFNRHIALKVRDHAEVEAVGARWA